MEKQKIFFIVIAAGAIFILLQQGTQIPNTNFNKSSYINTSGNSPSRLRLYHNPDDKTRNDLYKSAPKWQYSAFIHELTKSFSSDSLSDKNNKQKDKLRWHNRYNFIEKFAIYDGQKQARVLIIAYFRSGSSFIGDLLQQNWKSFYTFEPLHYMTRQTRINGGTNITEATNLISGIYGCDFEKASSYIKWIKNNKFLVRWNKFFWNVCKFRSVSLCYDDNFLSQVCRRSKFNVIKIVRLKLKHIEPILEQMEPTTKNLKIIYLVRDPRGIYNSRKSMEWCNSDECQNITSICEEMRQDLQDYDRLKLRLGDDLIMVRYEDIVSSDSMEQAKQLFQQVHIEFSPNVQRFFRTHTSSYKENEHKSPYSTYRANSSSTAIHWTKELNQTEIEYAQLVCKDVLQRLNYAFL